MSSSQRHIEAVRRAAAARAQKTIDLATRICQVPAPTGLEHERAALVYELFAGSGYFPTIDNIGNVTVRRRGAGAPLLLLLAHTDTVFPIDTDIVVTASERKVHAPGIGDNSLGVAAMIEALRILDELQIDTDRDIVAVANVGEEGLGNLRGARAAVTEFRHEIGSVVAIEGHNLGRVTHGAVGSVRLRVTVIGRGGHSWGAFGEPNAIHVLANIIADITSMDIPLEPKTTINVGLIEGGVSINTIAPVASAMVDMRSIDADQLVKLVERVRVRASSAARDGVRIDIEVLGERPAGSTPIDSPLVRAAASVLNRLGYEGIFDASSTDANIPISLGIPAVCVGVTTGGFGHTVDEYIDVSPVADGIAQLVLLCIEATQTIASDVRNA